MGTEWLQRAGIQDVEQMSFWMKPEDIYKRCGSDMFRIICWEM